MADFAAVLKKTIDAQTDQSPELRQRVYAKARSTIEQKLLAANAPEAVSTRQREMLDNAIAEVEASYAPPVIEPEAEPVGVIPEPPADPLEEFLETAQQDTDQDTKQDFGQTEASGDKAAPDFIAQDDAYRSERSDPTASARDHSQERGLGSQRAYSELDNRDGRSRSYKGLLVALAVVLVLGGGGYAAWINKDKLQELGASLGRSDTVVDVPGTDVTPKPTETVIAPDVPKEPAASQATPGESTQPVVEPKLTQRLLPDGSEVDEGPAGEQPGIGEGKSTASSTPGAAQTGTNSNQPSQGSPAIAVGQQALFYEERSGQEASSIEKGSVVWAVVQDSPGDGEPAEPVIRADVTVPDSKVNLRMTIRRNADKTIPASHLIEMIFTVPDNFDGGAIDNVQRVAFKETEQATGNPLVAVPNKIADNFFIIALNDARTAVDTNLALMRRQQWIDIPISYRNGRRALLSLEKGIPGDKVFDEVLKNWAVPAAATSAP